MLVKKKLIYILICTAIIVTAAIAVPLALLLPKDKPLKLETKDYSLTVGQIEKLEISVSNPYALVTYKISNEQALSIDNSNYMHAHKIGLVTVTINAKFKNEEASATSLVTITDLNSQPSNENQESENKGSVNDNQPNTEDETTNNNDNDKNSSDENQESGNDGNQNSSTENQKPNTENDNNKKDENNGHEQENNPNINNEFYINFTLRANFGCEIKNNKIFVKKNQLAIFMISIDISNEYLCDEKYNYEIVGKGISRNLDGLGWNILTDKDLVAKIIINGKEVDEILIFVEE